MTDDKPTNTSLDILGVKPVADAVSVVTKAAVDGAAQFLSALCMPATKELGLLFRDHVGQWRAKNAVAIAQRTEEKLKALDVPEDAKAHPRLLLSAVEQGSLCDNDILQEMWAGLLASSVGSGTPSDENMIFADVLERMTPIQAALLKYGVENSTLFWHTDDIASADCLNVTMADLHIITKDRRPSRIESEVLRSKSQEIMHVRSTQDGYCCIAPSTFGIELYSVTTNTTLEALISSPMRRAHRG